MIRLDKYITTALQLTRREAREIIKKKVISVNGIIVDKNDYKLNEESSQVSYLGKPIVYKEYHYIMVHKPKGTISANKDKHHLPVVGLLPERYQQLGLAIVGRLDLDTEGLMLLTNDGILAHQLTSPKSNISKTYYVEINKEYDPKDVMLFLEGLLLEDEGKPYRSKPAKLHIATSNTATVSITEGKTHQVKKMHHAIGKEVTYLKRLTIGSLQLDPTLACGDWRELTEEEIEQLKADVQNHE